VKQVIRFIVCELFCGIKQFESSGKIGTILITGEDTSERYVSNTTVLEILIGVLTAVPFPLTT